jgi:cytochrome c553
MLQNLMAGSVLVALSVLMHTAGLILIGKAMPYFARRLGLHRHDIGRTLVMTATVLGILGILTVEVWTWALAYTLFRTTASFADALYLSTALFSTVGYGPIRFDPVLEADDGARGHQWLSPDWLVDRIPGAGFDPPRTVPQGTFLRPGRGRLLDPDQGPFRPKMHLRCVGDRAAFNWGFAMKISRFPLVAFCATSLWMGAAGAQPVKPAPAASCEACHGAGGDSQKGDTPRLNGQQSDYLLTRLKEFLDPTRGTPHANGMMWGNATKISDRDAVALADYFSRQAPTRRSGMGAQVEAGRKIYLEGAGPDIPACTTCHGQDGEGAGNTPRITGQHQDYLVTQLQAFMLTARVGTPMNHHAWDMTAEQMQQLAAYLSNQ